MYRLNSVCFTGYRPDKFPFKLTAGSIEYQELKSKLTHTVLSLVQKGYTDFYCGMAQGFDIIAGEAVLQLKGENNIRLIAVIPYKKQSGSWGSEWKKRYDNLLSKADDRVYISDEYTHYCFHKRNRYMVDNADTVITFFNGKSGGTAATLRYAEQKGREIINIADENI